MSVSYLSHICGCSYFTYVESENVKTDKAPRNNALIEVELKEIGNCTREHVLGTCCRSYAHIMGGITLGTINIGDQMVLCSWGGGCSLFN